MRFELEFRTLMVASAALAVAFAALLLAFPGWLGGLFGLDLLATGRLIARLWGVELLGVGLLCWLLRGLPAGTGQSGLLLAFLLADIVGIAVLLHALLVGLLNALGWLALAFYLALAALYAHVWFWGRGGWRQGHPGS